MPELLPIWAMAASNYAVKREYKTEIITSRAGREQRRSLRETPRKTIEFSVNMLGTLWRRVRAALVSGQQVSWFLPDQSRATTLAEELAGGSPGTAVFTTVPGWVVEGEGVVLHDGLNLEYRTVDGIAGDNVQLGGDQGNVWPIGTKVYPAVEGYLATEIRTSTIVREALQVDIVFDVDPTTEPLEPPTAAGDEYNGREVFLQEPIRIAPIENTHQQYREDVDYGHGIVTRFTPVPFSTRLFKATYPTISLTLQDELRSLQDRMQGRRGEFHMPTFENDLPPLSSGANTLTVAGNEVANSFADSTTYKAVCVFYEDDTVQFNTATSIVVSGDDSLLTFADAWTGTITVDTQVSWMPAWRFATDGVDYQYFFARGAEEATVATVMFNLQMLEDLDPDTISP